MASGFTPTKTHTEIAYTPKTKQSLCILCGLITGTDLRRKLFHGSTKTDNCLLIETYLNITVSPVLHTDIVCRKCIDNLGRANATIMKHRKAYDETIEKLKISHGRESTKRLSSDGETKQFKRKSLFPETCDRMESGTESTEDASDKDKITVYVKGKDILQSSFKVQHQYKGILLNLLHGNMDECVNEMLKTNMEQTVLDKILLKVQKEIKGLCSKENPSILQKNDKDSLSSFTWEKMEQELKTRTPTFLQFLDYCSANPSQVRNKKKKGDALLPGIVTAGCKLLVVYNKEMNAIQHINSAILIKGGAKQSAFARFNSSFDCLSYSASLKMSDEFGKDWNSEIIAWAKRVDEESKTENGAIYMCISISLYRFFN